MKKITREDVFYIRCQKSGLLKPFNSALECASSLMGIQSQFQQFSEISLFNRVKGVTDKDLKKLFESGDIIKLWGQRNTVHLYSKDDWKFLCKIYSGRSNFVVSFFKDDMQTLKKGLAALEKALLSDKINKQDIKTILDKALPDLVHEYRDYAFILKATLDGIMYAVPERPYIKYYAHSSKVIKGKALADWKKTTKEKALEYVLTVYFRNYGPASFKDFLHWSGLTKTEALEAFGHIRKKLVSYDFNGTEVFLFKDDKDNTLIGKAKKPFVKLVGRFDPLFVSFNDKTWAMPKEMFKYVWRPAAHIESILLANMEAAGTWRYIIKGKDINFEVQLFNKISDDIKAQVLEEAKRIAGFLGKKFKTIKYTTVRRSKK